MKFKIKKLRFVPRWRGIVFWPWVFLKYYKIKENPLTEYDRRMNEQNNKSNERLFRHELEHVHQVKEHGRFMFLVKYVWLWIRGGFSYKKHPFELLAKKAETMPLTDQELLWKNNRRIEV